MGKICINLYETRLGHCSWRCCDRCRLALALQILLLLLLLLRFPLGLRQLWERREKVLLNTRTLNPLHNPRSPRARSRRLEHEHIPVGVDGALIEHLARVPTLDRLWPHMLENRPLTLVVEPILPAADCPLTRGGLVVAELWRRLQPGEGANR